VDAYFVRLIKREEGERVKVFLSLLRSFISTTRSATAIRHVLLVNNSRGEKEQLCSNSYESDRKRERKKSTLFARE
jgi:hypothetical protein